jgi:hypothetical protein
MKYEISKDRRRLTISIDEDERQELRDTEAGMDPQDSIHSDAFMVEFLERMICNSELCWIPEGVTADLTAAPMLGILGAEATARKINQAAPRHFGMILCGRNGAKKYFQPILERWAFEPYQVRSVVQDLMAYGSAVFVDRF